MKVFGPDILQESLLPGPRPLLRRLGGAQILVLSFLLLIAIGTLGFLVLPGLYTGDRLGVIDALFTATSAVCVTGLIVVDTATWFTPLGQAWLLALIQAGGIGIITFTTLVFSIFGRRQSLRLEEAVGGQQPVLGHVTPVQLIRTIVLVTLSIEAVGAAALLALWSRDLGFGTALWAALFHSVSAFCNAGFSTFSDSLIGFRERPLTLLVISALVILGGLGFIVLEDLIERFGQRRPRGLSAHSRIVLVATGALLLGGAVLFLAFEWGHELAGLAPVDKGANAFYMAVTPRTAGFNSVDYAAVSDPSLFLTIVLMVVGGSPGSMAGGVKTMAVSVLVLLFFARLRGERYVHAFGRTIPPGTVTRAASLAIGGLAILGSGVFLLLVVESALRPSADREHFVELVFEVHSAFSTVGLSMGATAGLSAPGRLIVVALMFLGRVGPAAVIAAMFTAGARNRPRFRYGEEDVNLA